MRLDATQAWGFWHVFAPNVILLLTILGCEIGKDPQLKPAADEIAALVPPAPKESDLPKLIEGSSPAVVYIQAELPHGWSIGSGFLFDRSGRIITNNHVVDGARTGAIQLPSGDLYNGFEIEARDSLRDIAVIRVRGFGLPALSLGDSDSVAVGTEVVAIGNPLGLQNTVSTGIISSLRSFDTHSLFQITVPTSPGSSGGPIMTNDGRVVGIVVSQATEGQNLNFAIPINYARGMLSASETGPVATVAPIDEAALSRAESVGSDPEAERNVAPPGRRVRQEVTERVAFAIGADYALLKRNITDQELQTFKIGAQTDQLMRVEIDSESLIGFAIFSPEGRMLDVQPPGSNVSSVRLFSDGDYEVQVVTPEPQAWYKILIEIR